MDKDVDMDAELLAHGYSNVASGLFGGRFEILMMDKIYELSIYRSLETRWFHVRF